MAPIFNLFRIQCIRPSMNRIGWERERKEEGLLLFSSMNGCDRQDFVSCWNEVSGVALSLQTLGGVLTCNSKSDLLFLKSIHVTSSYSVNNEKVWIRNWKAIKKFEQIYEKVKWRPIRRIQIFISNKENFYIRTAYSAKSTKTHRATASCKAVTCIRRAECQ